MGGISKYLQFKGYKSESLCHISSIYVFINVHILFRGELPAMWKHKQVRGAGALIDLPPVLKSYVCPPPSYCDPIIFRWSLNRDDDGDRKPDTRDRLTGCWPMATATRGEGKYYCRGDESEDKGLHWRLSSVCEGVLCMLGHSGLIDAAGRGCSITVIAQTANGTR